MNDQAVLANLDSVTYKYLRTDLNATMTCATFAKLLP